MDSVESATASVIPRKTDNSIIVSNVPYGIPLTDNSLESHFNRKSNGGDGGIIDLKYLEQPTQEHFGIAKIVFDNEESTLVIRSIT